MPRATGVAPLPELWAGWVGCGMRAPPGSFQQRVRRFFPPAGDVQDDPASSSSGATSCDGMVESRRAGAAVEPAAPMPVPLFVTNLLEALLLTVVAVFFFFIYGANSLRFCSSCTFSLRNKVEALEGQR